MKVIGLIPSRMASSRFPGKPLVNIEGLPMIIHVMKRASLCIDLDSVFVATDSEEIFRLVKHYGGKAIMTSKEHQTGTDRIAEAIRGIKYDIAINIQGDEILLNPNDISKLIQVMRQDSTINFATLVCKAHNFNDITDCKVVLDMDNNILYMSRADIPSNARVKVDSLYKLYCIVGFQKGFLEKFTSWSQTPLEKIEYIEYLRIIEYGHKIKAVVAENCAISVDTPEDLEVVNRMMKEDKVKIKYLNNLSDLKGQ